MHIAKKVRKSNMNNNLCNTTMMTKGKNVEVESHETQERGVLR